MARPADVWIGVGGHVVALDAPTGTEIWRTRLKGADVVTLRAAGKLVFAATKGEVFCLDRAHGTLLWHNRLKGLGTGIIAFASSGDEVAAAVRAAEEAAAAGAGA